MQDKADTSLTVSFLTSRSRRRMPRSGQQFHLASPRKRLSHEARRAVECPAIARCDMDMMRDMVFELHFGTAQGGTHQRNRPRKVRETLYCHLRWSRGLMKLT